MTKKKEGPQGEVEELLAAAPETKAESDDMPELSPTSRELLEWSKEELDKQVQERTKEISQEIDDETNKALSQQPPSPAEADSNLSIKQEQNNEGLIALAASSQKQIQEAANALPAGDIKPKAKPTAEKKPIRKTEEVATEAVKSKINGKFNQLQRLYRENKDLISKENYDRIRNTGYFSTLKKFRAIEKNNDLTPMEKLTELNRLNKELDEGLDFYKNELPNWKLEKMTDNIKQISEDTKSKIKAIPKIKDIDVLSKQNKTEIIPDQPAVVEPTAIFDRQSENLLFPGRINLNEEEKQWLKDRAEFMAQTEKDSGFKDRRQGLTVDNISEPEDTAWSIENKRKFREEFNQKLQEWEKAHPKPQYPAEQPIITPVKGKYAAPKTSENRKTPSSPITYGGTLADLLKNIPKEDRQTSPEPATEPPATTPEPAEQPSQSDLEASGRVEALLEEQRREEEERIEEERALFSEEELEAEPLLPEAIEYAVGSDSPISAIQRGLRIGYTRAQSIVDKLREKGIIRAAGQPSEGLPTGEPRSRITEETLRAWLDEIDDDEEDENGENLPPPDSRESFTSMNPNDDLDSLPPTPDIADELPPPPTEEELQRHEAARRPATPPVSSEATSPAAEPVVPEMPLSTPVEQGERPSSEASSSARVPEAAPSPSPETPAMPASRQAERPSGRTPEVPVASPESPQPTPAETPRRSGWRARRERINNPETTPSRPETDEERARRLFEEERDSFATKESRFRRHVGRKWESIKGIADRFMGSETNLVGRTIDRIANFFANRAIGKHDQRIIGAEEKINKFLGEIRAFEGLISTNESIVNNHNASYKERSKAQRRIHALEQKIRVIESKADAIEQKMGQYEDLKEGLNDRICERCRQVTEAVQDKLRPRQEQIEDARRYLSSLQEELNRQVERRRNQEDAMLELERRYMNIPRSQRATVKAAIDRARTAYKDNEKLIKQGRDKIRVCNDKIDHLNKMTEPWERLGEAYGEAAKLPERSGGPDRIGYQRQSAQDVIRERTRYRPEYSFETIDENSEVDLTDYVDRFNEQLRLEGIKGAQELKVEDVKGHFLTNEDRLTVGQIEVAIDDLYRSEFDDDERKSFLNAVRVNLAKETQEE